MDDIIDTIDALHAKATPGPWKAIDRFGILGADCSKVRDWEIPNADLIVALVNNWPALSARLREAERERDEWKLASEKNGEAMSGYQSRAIVAEQRLVEAERKANAFDEVAEGRIGIGRNGTNYRQWCAWRQGHGCPDGPTSVSANLLTAIQAALAAKETKQ